MPSSFAHTDLARFGRSGNWPEDVPPNMAACGGSTSRRSARRMGRRWQPRPSAACLVLFIHDHRRQIYIL